MNVKAIAAALLITTAALGLTACNEKDEPVAVAAPAATAEVAYEPEPTTSPPTTRPRASSHTLMEERFIDAIRERGIPIVSERQMIDLGRQTCKTLDSGASLSRVTDIAGDTMGSGKGAFFVGASIGAFCPELEYLVG